MTHRLSVHNPPSLNHRHRPCHTHHLPPRSIEAGGPPEQRGIARQRGHFRLDPQLKPPPCPATSNRDDGTKRAGQGSPTGCEPRHPSDGRTRGSTALNARRPRNTPTETPPKSGWGYSHTRAWGPPRAWAGAARAEPAAAASPRRCRRTPSDLPVCPPTWWGCKGTVEDGCTAHRWQRSKPRLPISVVHGSGAVNTSVYHCVRPSLPQCDARAGVQAVTVPRFASCALYGHPVGCACVRDSD